MIFKYINAFFFFLSLTLFLGYQWFFQDTPPIFDGLWYYRCIEENMLSATFESLNCFGHLSAPYISVLSLAKFFPQIDFIHYFHFIHTIIGILCISLFYKLTYLFGGTKNSIYNGIITLIFAINPIFLGNSLNINIDFPFVLAVLFFIYANMIDKKWMIYPSIFFIIFSRDYGIVIFGLYYIFQTIISLRFTKGFNIDKLFFRTIVSYFFFGIAIFVFYKYFLSITGWGEEISYTYRPFYMDIIQVNFIKNIFLQIRFIELFILNGIWIIILMCLYFLIHRIYQGDFFSNPHNRNLIFLGLFFLGLLNFILPLQGNMGLPYFGWNKVIIHPSPRYIIFLIPVFLLILSLLVSEQNKIKIKYIYIILVFSGIFIFLGNFRSLDPLSKLILGNRNFGEHNQFCVLSRLNLDKNNPFCGRDEVFYNGEYTNIYKLMREIIPLNPDKKNTLFIINDQMYFDIGWQISETTYLNNFIPSYFNYNSKEFSLQEKDGFEKIKIRPLNTYGILWNENFKIDGVDNLSYEAMDLKNPYVREKRYEYIAYIHIPFTYGNKDYESNYIKRYYSIVKKHTIENNGYTAILEIYRRK